LNSSKKDNTGLLYLSKMSTFLFENLWASEMTMNSTEVTRVPVLHVGKSEKVENSFGIVGYNMKGGTSEMTMNSTEVTRVPILHYLACGKV
jgi:hypothetical protein